MASELKRKTANSLKWNAIDRVLTQLLYAAVGIVLANLLSKEDFGLVGIILAFQAFAIIFVDSGFGAALLQKKEPTDEDYSTVLWFNALLCAVVYIILWFASPLIADIFGDGRLTLLCRVQFLAFILQGMGIVQTNRMMKRMDVKQIAIADTIALTISGVLAIILAIRGFGVWALVWQYVSQSALKTVWLWLTGHWLPLFRFSRASLREILPVGASVFSSSFLNTVSLQLYTFVIGLADGLASLGLYTQADKWSKMGVTTISQTLTSSFIPLMSSVQDSAADWERYTTRVNRFAAMLTLPAMIGLAAIATPLFHLMFATKWDGAIILFQMLCIRGVFVVGYSVINNYFVAAGKKRTIVAAEVIKDALMLIAVFSTVWFGSVKLLVLGQLLSSVLTWLAMLPLMRRATGYSIRRALADIFPFLWPALLMGAAVLLIPSLFTSSLFTSSLFSSSLFSSSLLTLILQLAVGAAIYIGLLKLTRQPELPEFFKFLSKKKV